jgi:DNA-binding CsgD family transcriptional regulator
VEVDICRCALRNQRNGEIADILGIRPQAVQRHIRNLYAKFAAHRRLELIVSMVRAHMKILLVGGAPASCALGRRLEEAGRSQTAVSEPHAGACPFLCDWAWETTTVSLGLSGREVDICRRLIRDMCEKRMAGDLRRSRPTVHCHVHRLFGKLGVSSRAAAVARILHEHIEVLHRTFPPPGCHLRRPLLKDSV